jgi:flagellar biosynthesis/type III secretory pathway protein FliH
MTIIEKYMEELMEEAREEGFKEGMEEGMEEERAKFFQWSLEIAKYLIKAGKPLNEVARLTQLDIKQLKKL